MGADCQNCMIANDYTHTRMTPTGFMTPNVIAQFRDPDFYNDITRAKSIELG